jgi:hypothetical protein
MWVPSLVLIAWFAYLAFLQGVLRIPVPARIIGGERVPALRVRLGWAQDHRQNREVEAQVATDRTFSNVIFQRRGPARAKALPVRPKLEPGVYYWRIRSFVDGRPSPWSRKIRFEVVE